jgi:hypothetical protein
MNQIIFFVVFGITIALTFYLAVDAKAQAQPWRFFTAAIIAIVVAFLFEYFGEQLNNSSPESLKNSPESLAWLNKLITLVCSTFAGGLASVAITNRAKYMHDEKSAALSKRLTSTMKELAQVSMEMKALKNYATPTDPADLIILREKLSSAITLWDRLQEEIRNLNIEMSTLKI